MGFIWVFDSLDTYLKETGSTVSECIHLTGLIGLGGFNRCRWV
jgi:hypothetical protein